MTDKVCAASDCPRSYHGRGWCLVHYARWRRYGTADLPARVDDVAERIARQVVRSDRCLLFTAGNFGDKSDHRRISRLGRLELVHRVVWTLARGPIPAGLCVLHRCDVGNCVNIDHLFLGTVTDNNKDRAAKGRSAVRRGSLCGQAKLTEWKVQEIRKRLRAGRTLHSLGAEYGVAWQTIGSIKYRQNWKHVKDSA